MYTISKIVKLRQMEFRTLCSEMMGPPTTQMQSRYINGFFKYNLMVRSGLSPATILLCVII